MKRYLLKLATAFVVLLGVASNVFSASTGWLDNDPGAIWSRPPGFYTAPGFYRVGGYWYAIIHVTSTVSSVRLAGDFSPGKPAAHEIAPSRPRHPCRHCRLSLPAKVAPSIFELIETEVVADGRRAHRFPFPTALLDRCVSRRGCHPNGLAPRSRCEMGTDCPA
jgi:hypothetical protein